MITERRVALQQFGLGELAAPPVEVAEAWSNEVYRVQTESGCYAIKVFPSLSVSRKQVLIDAVTFEQQALAAGVDLPVLVASVDGEVLAEFPTATQLRTARCHVWVHGTPASKITEDVEIAAAAGRVLGRLHALQVGGGDTSQLTGPDQDRWDKAVAAAADHHLPWATTMAAVTPCIHDLADRIELLRQERRPMQIGHRDFDPKNAVVDETGRLFVTDWDFAGPMLPGVELVTAAQSFARSDEQLRRFALAFREAGGVADPADDLALSVESAELDWILRNVESVLVGSLGPSTDQFRTAADLIGSFESDISDLQSCSRRLRSLLS